MARKPKPPQHARPAQPDLEPLAELFQTPRVQVVGRRGGEGTPTLDFQIPLAVSPERTHAIDCGYARFRHGVPEVVFAQLDPLDERLMTAVIVVRLSVERLRSLAAANELFRQGLETFLASSGMRGETGYFERLGIDALPARNCARVVIDADLWALSYAGGRGAIVIFRMSPYNVQGAVMGNAEEIQVDVPVELTMSMPVLADILASVGRITTGVSHEVA